MGEHSTPQQLRVLRILAGTDSFESCPISSFWHVVDEFSNDPDGMIHGVLGSLHAMGFVEPRKDNKGVCEYQITKEGRTALAAEELV